MTEEFWDNPDWQREGVALDVEMAKYSDRPFPPDLLDTYVARQRAFHRAMAREIASLNALPSQPSRPHRQTNPSRSLLTSPAVGAGGANSRAKGDRSANGHPDVARLWPIDRHRRE